MPYKKSTEYTIQVTQHFGLWFSKVIDGPDVWDGDIKRRFVGKTLDSAIDKAEVNIEKKIQVQADYRNSLYIYRSSS